MEVVGQLGERAEEVLGGGNNCTLNPKVLNQGLDIYIYMSRVESLPFAQHKRIMACET